MKIVFSVVYLTYSVDTVGWMFRSLDEDNMLPSQGVMVSVSPVL